MKTDRIQSLTLPFALLLALTAAPGCSGGKDAPAGQATGSAAAHMDAAPASASDASGAFVGKITQTMDAGTYTYVEVESGGERIWAAGPQTAVTVGQDVTIPLGMKMVDFESETLDRTFSELYFVNSLSSQPPAGHGMGGSGMAANRNADPHAGITQTDAPDVALGSIALPAGGKRIVELWGSRSALDGKSVTVRGQVVKVNTNIMGRNWMHLRDGSGDEGKGTHDLTVTAGSSAAVGDVVTVTGTVAVDKDFGAGYRYDLIVEDATLAVE
ncbi:DNA-binding protein [bacterium]|nr:DNA-binding protein [bacterium]